MAKRFKPRHAAQGEKKLVFRRRFSMRFDDDVLVLLNATVERGVDWDSQAHAVNAALRQALIPEFKPEGAPITISPFEQVVFAKRFKRRKS